MSNEEYLYHVDSICRRHHAVSSSMIHFEVQTLQFISLSYNSWITLEWHFQVNRCY